MSDVGDISTVSIHAGGMSASEMIRRFRQEGSFGLDGKEPWWLQGTEKPTRRENSRRLDASVRTIEGDNPENPSPLSISLNTLRSSDVLDESAAYRPLEREVPDKCSSDYSPRLKLEPCPLPTVDVPVRLESREVAQSGLPHISLDDAMIRDILAGINADENINGADQDVDHITSVCLGLINEYESGIFRTDRSTQKGGSERNTCSPSPCESLMSPSHQPNTIYSPYASYDVSTAERSDSRHSDLASNGGHMDPPSTFVSPAVSSEPKVPDKGAALDDGERNFAMDQRGEEVETGSEGADGSFFVSPASSLRSDSFSFAWAAAASSGPPRTPQYEKHDSDPQQVEAAGDSVADCIVDASMQGTPCGEGDSCSSQCAMGSPSVLHAAGDRVAQLPEHVDGAVVEPYLQDVVVAELWWQLQDVRRRLSAARTLSHVST